MNRSSELEHFRTVRVKRDNLSKELRGWVSESVLDPIRDELAKDVWSDSQKVKQAHREYILNTLSNWLEKMGVEEEAEQVTIIGSITTYQYAKDSDIDVNVVIDIPEKELNELLPMLPNGTLLPGTNHPVNYYLAKDAGENVSKKDSAYDLLNNKWIKKPKLSDVEVPYSYILEIAKFFMAGIENRISEYERDKHELDLYKDYLKEADTKIDIDELENVIDLKEMEIKADLDSLYVALKMVKGFRKEAFEDEYEPSFLITIETKKPDFRIENLVYKMVERFGYLDKLQKYKKIRKEQKGE
jgi:hypothetical protein